MKIKIIKEVSEFVEVELPIYKQSICSLYKVFSEEKCIQVCTLSGHESIGVHGSSLAFHGIANDCTKEEFETAFENVNVILKTII